MTLPFHPHDLGFTLVPWHIYGTTETYALMRTAEDGYYLHHDSTIEDWELGYVEGLGTGKQSSGYLFSFTKDCLAHNLVDAYQQYGLSDSIQYYWMLSHLKQTERIHKLTSLGI